MERTQSRWRALQGLQALYATLAREKVPLLGELPGAAHPEHWLHYPEGDARDLRSGARWYYHCHPPGRGVPRGEHGHFHLFAEERRRGSTVALRHLLAVGLRPNGLPCRLFTVNGWVTGDAPRSPRWTLAQLARLDMDTGHPRIDAFLADLCCLYRPVLPKLLDAGELRLQAWAGGRVRACNDRRLEVLASVGIDLDAPPRLT